MFLFSAANKDKLSKSFPDFHTTKLNTRVSQSAFLQWKWTTSPETKTFSAKIVKKTQKKKGREVLLHTKKKLQLVNLLFRTSSINIIDGKMRWVRI